MSGFAAIMTLAVLPTETAIMSSSAAGAVLGVALLVVVLILTTMADRTPRGHGRAAEARAVRGLRARAKARTPGRPMRPWTSGGSPIAAATRGR